MSRVITSVEPVRLFGQVVPNMKVVRSGDCAVGLLTQTGNRIKVLAVDNRQGGKLSDLGLDSRKVRKLER